jgi:hypothetical protein
MNKQQALWRDATPVSSASQLAGHDQRMMQGKQRAAVRLKQRSTQLSMAYARRNPDS